MEINVSIKDKRNKNNNIFSFERVRQTQYFYFITLHFFPDIIKDFVRIKAEIMFSFHLNSFSKFHNFQPIRHKADVQIEVLY